jgi:predicted regulator of Ras-like GTPase activity (Roadblock/LC7/MglB family)
MAGDMAKAVTELVQAVRQGRGALLMGEDGIPIVQAAAVAGVDVEAVAGEYAGLLHQARVLVDELQWGAPKSFSVRGASGQVVFAFAPEGLFLGVEAGPVGLRGQMRHALSRTLAQLGDL